MSWWPVAGAWPKAEHLLGPWLLGALDTGRDGRLPLELLPWLLGELSWNWNWMVAIGASATRLGLSVPLCSQL